jgi:hypothetical protein
MTPRQTRTIPQMTQKQTARFWSKAIVRGPEDCWTWARGKCEGYGVVGIGTKQSFLAHRVAFTLSKGPIPAGMDVLHSCDNRLCVNPNHLSPGTNADNVADRVKKDRSRKIGNRGDKCPTRVLSSDDVRRIRKLVAGGVLQKDLAAHYGVSRATISLTVNNKRWSYTK